MGHIRNFFFFLRILFFINSLIKIVPYQKAFKVYHVDWILVHSQSCAAIPS